MEIEFSPEKPQVIPYSYKALCNFHYQEPLSPQIPGVFYNTKQLSGDRASDDALLEIGS